ncbi:hypothetical protein MJG53_000941 [Ovis ammon polii x Ovis aries]|uniref:Uncharacterized protein n=1 Tax=Ovis ammon polii x Ovis aries TaxID=2918886 RepID=A0ACB9VIZ7_9CETA|nr:hypothetical protein MJT46_000435 [Ovis ammon polii x Ovis aries]KAI4589892.1 hypothetical protein MJG53_000941 [Ovis ammon polii x Ovis aries]
MHWKDGGIRKSTWIAFRCNFRTPETWGSIAENRKTVAVVRGVVKMLLVQTQTVLPTWHHIMKLEFRLLSQEKLKVTVSMDAKPQSKGTALDIKEWEQTFQELICQEKPRARWTLKMDGNLRPNCVAQGWRQYQQRGFGRFQCSSCRRSWASAQVQILFHMYLENQKSTGKVLMRIFGQRCKKCFQSQFEKPDFSPESSQRILKNLAQRVLEKFYRNGIRKASEIPVKPEVPLDGSHDKANCEACILGYCGLNLENCMTGPGKSSLSYMNTGSSSPHNENGDFIKIFWYLALKKDEVWRKIIPKNENLREPLQPNVPHNSGLGICIPLQSRIFTLRIGLRCSCCSPDQGLKPYTTAARLLWFRVHHVLVPLGLPTV